MKKLIMFVMVALLSGVMQAQSFEQGKGYLHAGIGVISPYAYKDSKMGIPPIHLSFEKAITENIGIGGLIGHTSSKYETSVLGLTYGWKFSYTIVGVRGAYHFTQFEEADVYAGGMLGYNIASAKFQSSDKDLEKFVTEPKVGGVAFGGFLGARKSVSESLTLFAEVGYSMAYLSAGVCFNL